MAGIIKSGVWQTTAENLSSPTFNFEDMASQAEQYLDSVRKQATQILMQAKEQVAAIETEARSRGQQHARQQAEQFSQQYLDQRLQSLLPALEQAVVAVQHARETWIRHWEQNTVKLAASIAERLVRRELSRNPEISLDWIREALELVTGEGQVTLHLHPGDYETLRPQVDLLISRLTKLGTATVVPDAAIEPGGCQVVTSFGNIDQQLQAQLQRIEDELLV
jgi:flagellar assembly protein FliH